MGNVGKSRVRRRLSKTLMSSVSSVIALSAGIIIAAPASAQTKIEQMVVTATKRALDIQQVPASISAFSGEGLQNRQVKTIDDLSHATPNVTFNMTGGIVPQLSIRGVSPDGTGTLLEGTVALHIDGVYQPRPASFSATMYDLESLEILRGPQGTVYGRNANAGVINLNTAKPNEVEFEGKGTIFGGAYKHYGARGYVTGPIAEGISARLYAAINRGGNYFDNLYNGDKYGGSYGYNSRLSVRLKPVETVTVDLSISQMFDHSLNVFTLGSDPLKGPIIANNSTGPTINSAGLTVPNGTVLGTHNYTLLTNLGFDTRYTLDPWKTYTMYKPTTDVKMISGSSNIKWDITPEISLKSITGWQYLTHHSYLDQDGMPAQYLLGRSYGDSHTWSQEFNLSARLFDRIDAVAGVYYLKDDIRGGNLNPIMPGNPVGSAATAGLFLINVEDQYSESKAAFLDLTVDVLDDLRLLGGIRRTIDDRTTIQQIQTRNRASWDDPFLPGSSKIAGCGPNALQPDLKFTSTTYKAGIQYDFTPDIMGFLKWEDGFKAGGYNSALCGNLYQPERVYSWEAGVKSTVFDGTTSINFNVFDYRYSNMQLSRTINLQVAPGVNSVATIIDNAATAKLRGAEIEVFSNLTDDLSMDFSIGYLGKAKYGPLEARNGAVPGNPLVQITGKRLPRAPKWTINAGLEYTMRVGDIGDLKTRGEYAYRSLAYYTPFNEAIAQQAGFSTWNIFFTLTPDDCPYEFKAYVKNITDKAYRNSNFTSGIMYMTRVNWATPRWFGFEASAKF